MRLWCLLLLVSVTPSYSDGDARWRQLRAEQGDLWDGLNSKYEVAMKRSIPYSLLHVLEEFPAIVEATKAAETVHLHMLGATFPTEGRADWRLAKRILQPLLPAMKELRVLINIATP